MVLSIIHPSAVISHGSISSIIITDLSTTTFTLYNLFRNFDVLFAFDIDSFLTLQCKTRRAVLIVTLEIIHLIHDDVSPGARARWTTNLDNKVIFLMHDDVSPGLRAQRTKTLDDKVIRLIHDDVSLL